MCMIGFQNHIIGIIEKKLKQKVLLNLWDQSTLKLICIVFESDTFKKKKSFFQIFLNFTI